MRPTRVVHVANTSTLKRAVIPSSIKTRSDTHKKKKRGKCQLKRANNPNSVCGWDFESLDCNEIQLERVPCKNKCRLTDWIAGIATNIAAKLKTSRNCARQKVRSRIILRPRPLEVGFSFWSPEVSGLEFVESAGEVMAEGRAMLTNSLAWKTRWLFECLAPNISFKLYSHVWYLRITCFLLPRAHADDSLFVWFISLWRSTT